MWSCLARSEIAINSEHSKFKRRRQRPTSDPEMNYCQWDRHSCIRHIYRMIREERSIFSSLWKKNVHMNMCRVMYGCWDTAVWIYKYQSILNGNKEKLLTTSTLIWWLNNKFVTVHNKRSKIPLSASVHFATRVGRSRVVRLSWSSRFFCWQQHPKCEPAVRLVYPRFLLQTSLSTQTHKQKSNGIRSGDSNTSISVPIQNETRVHMCTWNSTYINVSSWITLYKSKAVNRNTHGPIRPEIRATADCRSLDCPSVRVDAFWRSLYCNHH